MAEVKPDITINGHPVPERVWIDFRDEPANRYWRVYTAPNAFASVGYTRISAPAEKQLREALAECAIPYEALLLDQESRRWIAPEIWKAIENAVKAARTALGEGR